MAIPQIKTYATIVSDMITSVGASVSGLTNFNVGSVIRTIIDATALPVGELYQVLTESVNQRFLDTAEGLFLQRIALEYGLTQGVANPTKGDVIFTRPTTGGSKTIPQNTIVATKEDNEGNRYRFLTTATKTITIGFTEVTVPVQAEYNGAAYNVTGNQITEIASSLSGVSVTNSTGWINTVGTDAEEEEDFRTRILNIWNELSRGSIKEAYESWALNADSSVQYSSAKVNTSIPGQVDVIIIGESGLTPPALISTVQSYINERKPIAVNVLVNAPTQVSLDITMSMTPNDSYNDYTGSEYSDAIDVLETSITTAIDGFIDDISIGQDLVLSSLVSTIVGVSGVYSVTITSPTANIPIGSDSIGVTGTITINTTIPSDE